jgi:hypothetical protein
MRVPTPRGREAADPADQANRASIIQLAGAILQLALCWYLYPDRRASGEPIAQGRLDLQMLVATSRNRDR